MAKTTKRKEDKLMQAQRARQRTVTLAECGVDLELRKWNSDQIAQNSGFLIDVVRDLASSTDPDAIQKFMKADLKTLLGTYKKGLLEILSNTLFYDYSDEGAPIKFTDNFDDKDGADAFLRVLSAGDLIGLVHEIYKDNFGPLAVRLGLAGKAPAEILRMLQAMKLPTS